MLLGVGLSDIDCPSSTQFAAYNTISGPKRVLMYPDHKHEDLPGHGDAGFAFLSRL